MSQCYFGGEKKRGLVYWHVYHRKNLKNIVGNHDSYGNQNFKTEIVIFIKVWVLKNIEIKPTEKQSFLDI